MRPTRKIVAEFVGVFLIGALAGGLLTYSTYTESQLSSFMTKSATKPEDTVARINKRYADTYHLTPDELTRIQPIVKEMAEHIYTVRRTFGQDMLSTLDDYHAQIAAQLDPDHRAAYIAGTAARRQTLAPLLLLDENSPSQASK